MTNNDHRKLAIEKAKEKDQEAQDKIVFVEGVAVKIHPVSSSLIQEVTSKIKDPKVPMRENPDKGNRLEPNPLDPDYLNEVDLVQNKRNTAAADTLAMFGFELLEGLPEDDEWIKKLKFLEKRGAVDLSEYDLEDPFEKEFLFKKYMVSSGQNIGLVTRASGGLNTEEIAQAEESFPGQETR